MKLDQLFESKTYHGDDLDAFYEKYGNKTTSNLYILLSDDMTNFSASKIDPFPDYIAVIPLEYFIARFESFKHTHKKYLSVVQITGDTLHINKLTFSKYLKVAHRYGIGALDASAKASTKELGEVLLPYLVDNNRYFDNIIDTSKSYQKPILNKEYHSIGFIKNQRDIHIIDTYKVKKTTTTVSSDTKTVQGLAERIAEAMDTELSSDAPVKYFLEYYFWTVDGVEIRITETIGDSGDDDNSYYVIEAETPNGLLLHTTGVNDTYDDIIRDVRREYNDLNYHDYDWQPMSRDLFLSGHRYMYKMLDGNKGDIVKTFDKWYPVIRSLGLKEGIKIKDISIFSEIGKVELFFIIVEFIFKEKNTKKMLDDMKENGEDVDSLVGRTLSSEINLDLVSDISEIYKIGKTYNPHKNGWSVFDVLQ